MDDAATITRRQHAEIIRSLTEQGKSASEIALVLGMTRQRVMRIAAQFHVRLQPRGGSRRIGTQFSGKRYKAIEVMAERAGVSTGTMLSRIVAYVVDAGPQVAARRLGRDALPKRPYRRKP